MSADAGDLLDYLREWLRAKEAHEATPEEDRRRMLTSEHLATAEHVFRLALEEFVTARVEAVLEERTLDAEREAEEQRQEDEEDRQYRSQEFGED